MNFDDYVNHISQKIRLATAIAVLRSKPKNLSTVEYIEKLRNNIEHMECDSDVTICSDDFEVECDDVTNNFENTFDIRNINSKIFTDKDVFYENTEMNNKNNDKVIHSHVIDKETHNDIGHETVDPQNKKSNKRNDSNGETSKVTDFVEILHELKQVDNSFLVKTHLPQNNDISQTQDITDDIDSDATYCETIPNTQVFLNNDNFETEIYSISDYTPFYTHYSESQMQIRAVEPKMIYKNENDTKTSKTLIEYSQYAQNNESLNELSLNKNNTEIHDTVNSNGAKNLNYPLDTYAKESNFEKKSNINDKYLNSNAIDIASERSNYISSKNTGINYINNGTGSSINTNNNPVLTNYTNDDMALNDGKNNNFTPGNDAITEDNTHTEVTNTTTRNVANDVDNESNNSEDLTDSQREIVSFKVIEELNKIKSYLKKYYDRRMSVDGSSDSGYRSDSQGRNSRNFVQLSGTSLNQSAHSLLTHLITSSLTANTYEITREVSRTLGSLIDKLHENEVYPPFLEIHLDTITELLRSIHEDGGSNVLLTKDEKVQRVLLLNKSTHIQKYTIDKITAILETIDAEANEINQTAKMENLCYIFHILEIILSKYKIEDNSQSQDSQEKVLKRSSITDIWRKKWNLSKEVVVDNVDKKCALTKCSEVLNKMIVSYMEGYSLISFVALKCFNLLQP